MIILWDSFAFLVHVKNLKSEIGVLYVNDFNEYDNEGNLISIFGGNGIQNGKFKRISAIEKWNGNYLGVYADNQVAIQLYKNFGFKINSAKIYKDGTVVYFMNRK